MAECEGVAPVKDIYSHISGIDLVKGKDGQWYILEDNLRVPSGASYPMIARELRVENDKLYYVTLEGEGRIAKDHKILILPSVNPYSMNTQKRF